ncbi:LysE family translocator [Paenactinomyces guangxiensis]|uniref:LysE family translocator n=1 Tax=Paenactinomyces guangxiensis TaxID=1490290 RepID=A0A7W1WV74_9BACL|nr:LysE family translocator [Paenactinomyces guangxiensis]MBA4496588.1 LysE family translocator [Paenactinomyces guangxiensis]MBH8593708.1 LysE family translocator [Paenactinomyces guangxiensis]
MYETFLIGLALAISLGPDFLLMTKNTLTSGRKIGYMTLLGNRCSLLVHMTFAIMGLSVILQKSVLLFSVIRILGAIYLIYLGYKTLSMRIKNKGDKKEAPKDEEQITSWQAFRSGLISNLLNPKVSLFF